jgi:methylated-DNA-protein-cysteine methyltransferase-like protein
MSSRTLIYDVVRSIPRGRVSTYGDVAKAAGLAGHARQVGYALAALEADTDVPWHRVVNAQGRVSARRGDRSSESIQQALLEAEGVRFVRGGSIDLEQFRHSNRSKTVL